MSIIRVAVIMAGGSGERFWPLSRRDHPKQLLRLADPDRSLLQEAVQRLDGIIEPEHIYVATARHLREAILAAAGLGIPDANVIAEPCKRNTTGCLCYAAAVLATRYEDVPADRLAIAVLTADHCISDADAFRRCVATALEAAVDRQALVTIGIQPTRAETGYGHIEYNWKQNLAATPRQSPVHPVLRFLEKPDSQKAEAFFKSGNFLWNSGMFFWTLETFTREISDAQPGTGRILADMVRLLRKGDTPGADARFGEMDNISIDYALLEKASNVLVVPAAFHWDDIGSWDALRRTFPVDARGNVSSGDAVLIDAADSIVYNAARKPVAVVAVGVRDLVVVVADDAVLVVPRNRAQDVKKAVLALKEKGANQL